MPHKNSRKKNFITPKTLEEPERFSRLTASAPKPKKNLEGSQIVFNQLQRDFKKFVLEDCRDALRGLFVVDFIQLVKQKNDWRSLAILILVDSITLFRAFSMTIAPIYLNASIKSVSSEFHTADVSLFGFPVGRWPASTSLYIWAACLAIDKLLKAFNEIITTDVQFTLISALFMDDKKLIPVLHSLTFEEFEKTTQKTSASSLARLITSNVEQGGTLMAKHVHEFIMLIGTLVFSFTILLREQNNQVTLSLAGFFFYNLMARISLAYFKRNFMKITTKQAEEFTEVFIEDLQNMQTIKLNMHDIHKTKEMSLLEKFINYYKENNYGHTTLQFLFIDLVLFAACMLMLYTQDIDNTNKIDESILLINYFILFYLLLQTAGTNFIIALTAVFNIKRIEEIINNKNIEEINPEKKWVTTTVSTEPVIEFENVTLNINGKKLVANLNFKVYENQSLALVGSSGSGKTTVIRLIIGMYMPTEGTVRVRGKDTRKMSPQELRANLTYISSDPQIWSKTNNKLIFNVLYGHVKDEKFLASLRDRNPKEPCALFLISAENIISSIFKQLEKWNFLYGYVFLNKSLYFVDIPNQYSTLITQENEKITALKQYFSITTMPNLQKIKRHRVLDQDDFDIIEEYTGHTRDILKENPNIEQLYQELLIDANIKNLPPHLPKPSDGEKQRVGLARGWPGNTEITVLDEPTSKLDPITQQDIIKKFNQRIQDSHHDNKMSVKVLVVAAHALTTVMGCDQVLVMEGGEIINNQNLNTGVSETPVCHPRLYRDNKRYKEYFDAQNLTTPSFSMHTSLKIA